MANSHRVSPFERIRHTHKDGGEYWSARDLAKLLKYSTWQKFQGVIERARTAAENSDQGGEHHFNLAVKLITGAKSSQREIESWHLTRYACYLIAQNADPSKEIVAEAQTYFAVQTRRAELADEAALAATPEEAQRLWTRDQMTNHNKSLSGAVYKVGVKTSEDFARFHDSGYRGLYGGMCKADIATRKGLPVSASILDHMGFPELVANLFRATQTEEILRLRLVSGKAHANQTHWMVGTEVREAIKRIGGIMPEASPMPAESIPQLKRKIGRNSPSTALPTPKRRARRGRAV